MRTNHAVALITIIFVGIAVKLFFFAALPTEADARSGVDISRMHIDNKLPVQKLHDKTFDFSTDDWP